MPKVQDISDDPIVKFYVKRREGFKPYPRDTDRLNRKLAEGLLNTCNKRDSTKFPANFEFATNPFYRAEKILNGKFVHEYQPLSATGGIFNLEFSPDGKILSAACERKNILIFDPLTRKVVNNLENAHRDCVNCVRFLDSRTFATCSDDTTVALWDVRNLKSRVRTLRGHSNWVKNIEYSRHDNVLVTSGFDGAIYTWDINQYSESNLEYEKVFYTNGLMRMRLTPDVSKMVISTLHGYLVVIHNLDLNTLTKDLEGFKPNMYRLMQMTGKTLELAVNFTKLFHAKRNRVEIISDFPDGNDAEIISSLRLHPQGWVAVSRNTSSDEASEWCCVHDIQTVETSEEDDEEVKDDRPLTWSRSSGPARVPLPPPPSASSDGGGASSDTGTQTYRSGGIEIISTGSREEQDSEGRPVIHIDLSIRRRADNQGSSSSRPFEDDGEAAEEEEVDGANFLSANSMNALEIIGELRQRNRHLNRAQIRSPPSSSHPPPPTSQASDPRVGPRATGGQEDDDDDEEEEEDEDEDEGDVERRGEGGSNLINIVGVGPELPGSSDTRTIRNEQGGFLIIGGGGTTRRRVLYFGSPAARRAQQERVPKNARIHKNISRLTHSIEESNTGRGYIKEQSFSPCGRFIASPFGFGIRLLGWDERGSDLSTCVPDSPARLYELGTKIGHTEDVLSSAFSPCHWILVSGCKSGRIAWNQPII